jgi:phage shock protein A
MFRKIKEALDAALSALESRSGSPAEDLDQMLAAMREELIETKARLPELEKQIQTLQAGRARTLEKAEETSRRAKQALAIDDPETVEVALRFEARYRTEVEVYEQKIEAAQAELVLQHQTVADMTAQLKAALARKDSIGIQARRAGSTERLRGSEYSSVDDFDRLADEIERQEEVGTVERDMDLELEGLGDATGRDRTVDPEELAEFQLRELKRRMNREGDGS